MTNTSQSIAKLIHDLQEGDDVIRSQAAFALGMLGEPAVHPLTQLLNHPNSDVRMRVAWALGVIGADALPLLLELTESSDLTLRVEAIRVLGVVGEARALNQLMIALTDSDEQVAARAARALGKISDPRAYHPLMTALRHPSADVRYEACRALADLHIADSAVALLELAEQDTTQTSWGVSVSETARWAANEAKNTTKPSREEEFARVSSLLRQQKQSEG